MVPYDLENEDEAYYGYGRQEGHAKPNSNQSSRPSTTKQVSQLLLGLVGALCSKIMIFSPFHKECGGRSPFHLCNNENAYGQGRVESDPEVALNK